MNYFSSSGGTYSGTTPEEEEEEEEKKEKKQKNQTDLRASEQPISSFKKTSMKLHRK